MQFETGDVFQTIGTHGKEDSIIEAKRRTLRKVSEPELLSFFVLLVFWKQQLRLKSRRPVRRTIRALDVAKELCIHVHRQFPEVNDLPHSAADRHYPSLVWTNLPVRSNDR